MNDLASTLESMVPIVAILSTIALPIGLGMYVAIRNNATKHKERMELIKQGIIPPESNNKPTPNKYRSLRNGFLCIGIALGFIIALLISRNMNLHEDEAVWVVISGILLFLGIAYVAFYLIVKDKEDLN